MTLSKGGMEIEEVVKNRSSFYNFKKHANLSGASWFSLLSWIL
jgi:hypothetical protein